MTFKRTRCPYCKGKLEPGQRIHPDCIEPWALEREAKKEREEAKKARMAAKVERAEDRRKREAFKTIPGLTRESQIAFNAFIRLRDQLAGHSCISSGRALDWSGNAVDAGHYRSTGAAPHLRFNEDNCHAQSKFDNQWRAGNVVDYRIRLIERIGIERVEALEADNQVHKWTREELIEIRDHYRAKVKEMRNG